MITNRLPALLGERKMKVTQFSRGSEVSIAAAYRLYHDKVSTYDKDVLDRTCRFLGIQPGDLLVYVPDGEEKDR